MVVVVVSWVFVEWSKVHESEIRLLYLKTGSGSSINQFPGNHDLLLLIPGSVGTKVLAL